MPLNSCATLGTGLKTWLSDWISTREQVFKFVKSCFALYGGAFLSVKGIDLRFKICVNLNNKFVDKIRENRVWQFLHMDENE